MVIGSALVGELHTFLGPKHLLQQFTPILYVTHRQTRACNVTNFFLFVPDCNCCFPSFFQLSPVTSSLSTQLTGLPLVAASTLYNFGQAHAPFCSTLPSTRLPAINNDSTRTRQLNNH
jgi:hypothetical protein